MVSPPVPVLIATGDWVQETDEGMSYIVTFIPGPKNQRDAFTAGKRRARWLLRGAPPRRPTGRSPGRGGPERLENQGNAPTAGNRGVHRSWRSGGRENTSACTNCTRLGHWTCLTLGRISDQTCPPLQAAIRVDHRAAEVREAGGMHEELECTRVTPYE